MPPYWQSKLGDLGWSWPCEELSSLFSREKMQLQSLENEVEREAG